MREYVYLWHVKWSQKCWDMHYADPNFASNWFSKLRDICKEKGVKVGVVLNPMTSLNTLEHIFSDIDMVLLMSVNPGFGGQKFIPEVFNKIRTLRDTMQKKGVNVDLEVDGGIKIDNISKVVEAGANVIVAGSAVFNNDNPADVIRQMKHICLNTGKNN